MKITALVENTTKGIAKAKHGLSLHIATQKQSILFDLGSDETLFTNAKALGIDIASVDTVIISHGHYDHGGALEHFLRVNTHAKVYIQRKAFDEYYSKAGAVKKYIGLDKKLADHEQIVCLDGDYSINDTLRVFTVAHKDKCYSDVNTLLYAKDAPDTFEHEQHALITEQKTVLLMGCGHAGIVNIMEKAQAYAPDICVGGYHLYSVPSKHTVGIELLEAIAHELRAYTQTVFYTCHCTGEAAFQYLSQHVPNMYYLSCGECIEL